MEVLKKLFKSIKIKFGFLKMRLFYNYINLEYRLRRLERKQYWREKYKNGISKRKPTSDIL
tara:strand:- start:82 stop:264 length:183 start_codon:yes stop_codon:yes gene_type:complete